MKWSKWKTVRWYLREWAFTAACRLDSRLWDIYRPVDTWLLEHGPEWLWKAAEKVWYRIKCGLDNIQNASWNEINRYWDVGCDGKLIRVIWINRCDECGNERSWVCQIAANDPRPWGEKMDLKRYELGRWPLGTWVEFTYEAPDPARDAALRRYEFRGPAGLLPAHSEGF